jgi:DNA modification methylase
VADKFKAFGLTPVKALHIIATLENKKAKAIIRYFAQQFQMQVPQIQAAANALVNNCHHCDIRDLMPRIPSGAVHLFFVDPPFLRRLGVKTGLVSGTGMARTECDSADEKAALKLTVDIMAQTHRLLVPGGVLVLCQPSGLLDFRIHRAIHDLDLHGEAELFWAKGRTRPGNPRRPYSTELERLLILVPAGQHATCWGKPLHSDLLTFPAVNLVRRSPRSVHVLQKPQELCQFLVRQHSPANGLVLDACGCSGAMTVAAMREGRNWIYCESNKANFDWGSHRIAASFGSSQSQVA